MIQTHRTIDLVLNVTQTGTLVVNKLALVILLTDTILNINFLLSWFVGMDDIVQHQHIVRRLARPRVGFGVHARTDATYEHLELGSLKWRVAADSLNHVRRD